MTFRVSFCNKLVLYIKKRQEEAAHAASSSGPKPPSNPGTGRIRSRTKIRRRVASPERIEEEAEEEVVDPTARSSRDP